MDIYGLQKLTLLDFPGRTACIVFTGGCSFRCPFCYNSSLVDKSAPSLSEKDVLDYLSERRKLLDGVCVTGGEPTLNADLPDFLRKIKAMGLQTKLDTNGASPSAIKALIDDNLLDYVATDIKNSPEKYSLTAGCAVDTDKIALTARIIRNSGIEFEFRTTVTEELHEESDFDAIGKWLGGKGKYFLQAVTDNGELLSGKSFHAPSSEKLGKYAGLLRNYGFDASVRKA